MSEKQPLTHADRDDLIARGVKVSEVFHARAGSHEALATFTGEPNPLQTR